MRLRDAVASSLHLLVILFYSAFGSFLMFLPRRLDWRLLGIHLLDVKPSVFYLVGAGFLGIGFLFFLGFYKVGRGKYLRLAMHPKLTSIDAKLLERTVGECLKRHQLVSPSVSVSVENQLEIVADSVALPEEKELKVVEEELGKILRDRFGYTQPFTLSLRSK
jgi:hypothetical protein